MKRSSGMIIRNWINLGGTGFDLDRRDSTNLHNWHNSMRVDNCNEMVAEMNIDEILNEVFRKHIGKLWQHRETRLTVDGEEYIYYARHKAFHAIRCR